jgi:hypothetical protein
LHNNIECFDISVVVNGIDSIGGSMVGVDHVVVSNVCSCSFVCEIDRVFECDVSYWKCFVFCVPRIMSYFMLVIYLSEARRHLTAIRCCSCDEHELRGCWDVVVVTVSCCAEDSISIMRISWNHKSTICFSSCVVCLLFK